MRVVKKKKKNDIPFVITYIHFRSRFAYELKFVFYTHSP